MTNDVRMTNLKGSLKGRFLLGIEPSVTSTHLNCSEPKKKNRGPTPKETLNLVGLIVGHRAPSPMRVKHFFPRQHCSARIELSTAREGCGASIGQQSSLLRRSAGSRSGKRRETTVFSDGLSRLGIGASPNQNGCQSAVPNCNRASESSSVFRLAQLASFMSLKACR
jgi:hypothetical protein